MTETEFWKMMGAQGPEYRQMAKEELARIEAEKEADLRETVSEFKGWGAVAAGGSLGLAVIVGLATGSPWYAIGTLLVSAGASWLALGFAFIRALKKLGRLDLLEKKK